MKRNLRSVAGGLLALGGGVVGLLLLSTRPGHDVRPALPRATGQDKPAAVDGRTSYQTNCAFCHGKEGKGDGPAAYLLYPKPRDFTKGAFKLKSTGSGEMPTDDDLFRTITEGMPGSAMLSWRWMPEAERRELVQEVKRLSSFYDEDSETTKNFFETRGKGTPIAVPPEPALTPRTIARGKEVYFRLECQKCHGGEGKGDGPSAKDLKDDWGLPITPRDFTTGVFKGGAANRDLFLRISGGVGGTPMPAFGGQVSDDDRWALVHFVHSLTRRPADRPAVQSVEGDLVVSKVDAVPSLPEDPRWGGWKGRSIPLIQLFQGTRKTDVLGVKAVHDGKSIAFLLEWDDSSINSEVLRVQDFRDGAAIQFAVRGPTTPLMGAPGMPVNLWHWKADWQADLGLFHDVETTYPGMQMDMYPMTHGDQTTSHFGKPPSALSTDPAFLSGAAAKNPLSATRRTSPVEDLAAIGFGTLTSQPKEQQNVQGCGAWMGGRWHVVFRRDLSSADEGDAAFVSGRKVTVSFAVWDGSARDRNGQKSVSSWYTAAVE